MGYDIGSMADPRRGMVLLPENSPEEKRRAALAVCGSESCNSIEDAKFLLTALGLIESA